WDAQAKPPKPAAPISATPTTTNTNTFQRATPPLLDWKDPASLGASVSSASVLPRLGADGTGGAGGVGTPRCDSGVRTGGWRGAPSLACALDFTSHSFSAAANAAALG